MIVELCSAKEIRNFIETWHYSKNIEGTFPKYCFKLTYEGRLIGACIFGQFSMTGWRKYGERKEDVLELRRLCCIDDTPRNTESYFIGHCLRWLKRNTDIKTIISYADPEYGHKGIIYQASNFKYLGVTQPKRVIIWNGRRYHERALRVRNKNGELQPLSISLKEALENGEAFWHKTPGKHIYRYDLRPREKKRGFLHAG